MMKICRILVLGLFVFSGCKPQELNVIRDLGRRVRVSTADGLVYAELANAGDKVFLSNDRTYTWYAKGLINHTQGDYAGKLLHGEYLAYDALNKQLKEKGTYAYGLKQGKWLRWYTDGKLLESQCWYRGLKNGKTILYDSLGKEKQITRYKNGQLTQKHRLSLLKRLKKIFKKKKS